MSLDNELNAFKAEFLSKVDTEVVAAIEKASAELEKVFQAKNCSV